MVEKIMTPSELHLRKELTAVRKAHFLRDPETCSSWRFLRDPEACSSRSHHSSKSVSAYCFSHDNETRHISTRENMSNRLLEIPKQHEKTSKKAYLCNWKTLSSISDEQGVKQVDDGKKLSPKSSFEDNINKEDTEDTRRFFKANACKAGCREITSFREATTKSKMASNGSKTGLKHSSATKHLNLPLSTLGFFNSIELSNDTEHCNSENAHDIELDLFCKATYQSPSLSPLFPGSGCTNWSRTSKLFSSTRKEGSPHSCTPASTSSLYRKIGWKPSTVGSCCVTADSSEEEELDHLDLPARQGCGLPCYRSMRRRDSSYRDYLYPALSDTTRTKSESFFGERHIISKKMIINGFNKSKVPSASSKSLPLLADNCEETSSGGLSANLRELDLESLSRLDGRRWPSCKIQDAFELPDAGESSVGNTYNKNSDLMHKPRTFDEIIGQNIVVHSLKNAILRGKISPAYLFYGPPGTGKKSAARIFSAAIVCVATKGNKPCYMCKECTAFYEEQASPVREGSAANSKSIELVINFIKNTDLYASKLRYAICIIDECHLLTSKMWSKFLRFLEEPYSPVIFIFITTDLKHLPQAILSLAQKYLFSKIKESDILWQLKKLFSTLNLDIEMDALNAIAENADGSLQNAETMVYQLSLLEKRITTTLVNDLVGVISDERLLDLLEVAISSKTVETVKRSIELLDSGVDPMSLLAQLVSLIMDIIAGTKQFTDSKYDDVNFEERSLTEDELKRLEHAVRILSDAEKQFKHSTKHSSLFITVMLQLASVNSIHSTQLKCSEEQPDTVKTNNSIKECFASLNKSSNLLEVQESNSVIASDYAATRYPLNLHEIWKRCIENCHSRALRQMISVHGKLVSLTEHEGTLIAFIAFSDNHVKLRAERYSSCIAKLFEMVLKQNVHVEMDLIFDNKVNAELLPDSRAEWQRDEFQDSQGEMAPNAMSGSHRNKNAFLSKAKESYDGTGPKKLENYCSSLLQNGGFCSERSFISSGKHNGFVSLKEREIDTAVLKIHGQAFNDQRLDNEWTQTDNGENGKQIYDLLSVIDKPLKQWEDGEKNSEIKTFEPHAIHTQNRLPNCEDMINGTVSPILLHSNNFGESLEKENLEFESTKGCGGLFCWKNNRPRRHQAKLGVHPRLQKASRIFLCGRQAKPKLRGKITSN